MYKHSYLANIFDKKLIPEEAVNSVPIEEKKSSDFFYDIEHEIKQKKKSEYSNHRSKIFCKCGHSFEFKINLHFFKIHAPVNCTSLYEYAYTDIDGHFKYDLNRFEPITCSGCNHSYSKTDELIMLEGKSRTTKNTVFSKFLCFENEKSITLYNFARYVIIGVKKKNIVYKEQKTFVSYNKVKKCFFLYRSGKNFGFIRIPLRTFFSHFNNFLFNFIEPIDSRMSIEEKERFILNPLTEYLTRIQSTINEKDVVKIQELFSQNKNIIETLHIPNIIINNSNVEFIKSFNFICEKIKFYSLISIFPNFSTIIFTKGLGFLKNMISHEVTPSLSMFQKLKPTSPIKIFREMFILKLKTDYFVDKKIVKHIDKVNKKRKKEKDLKNSLPHVIIEKYRAFKAEHIKPPTYLTNQLRYSYGIINIDSLNRVKITKKMFREIKNPETFIRSVMSILHAEKEKFRIEDAFTIAENTDFDVAMYAINNLLNRYEELEEQFPGNFIKFVKHFIKIIIKTGKIQDGGYCDCIRMIYRMNCDLERLFNCKINSDVEKLHYQLVSEAQKIALAIHDEKLKIHSEKHKHLNDIIDDVQFELLDTSEAFVKETQEMNHCVSSYTGRVAEGWSLIFKITDIKTNDRATISYTRHLVNKEIAGSLSIPILTDWKFEQVKAKNNEKPTNKITEASIKFSKNIKAIIEDHHLKLALAFKPEFDEKTHIQKQREITWI